MRSLTNHPIFVLIVFIVMGLTACTSDQLPELPDPNASVVWTGPTITFTKVPGSDPMVEANQDRLTSNVWITRNNDGGQIYNIQVEGSPNQDSSPVGTLWAVGSIDNVDNLDFVDFRAAVGMPRDVAGQNLVAFLVEDNTFLSVRFTQWSQGQSDGGGGFAYERSTPQ